MAAYLLLFCAINTAADSTPSNVYIEDTDRFPGWKGELPRAIVDKTIGYGQGGVVYTPPFVTHETLPGLVELCEWKCLKMYVAQRVRC